MRPPLVTEQAIRTAVREVAASGARLTGVAVRELLARRYGARGGVSRIYRLIQEIRAEERERAARRSTASRASDSGETREAAIERADLAEHRERAHQERWARETDALRARLAAAELAARDAELASRRVAELARALATAQARIAELERGSQESR
jgi:hypothetical protein